MEKALSRPAASPAQARAGAVGRFFARLLTGALGRLSRKGLARLARIIGGLVWALRIRRRVTLENLAGALPEVSEAERVRIARGAYRNMALAALESLGSAAVPDEDLERVVEVEGWERMEAARAEGKGVLVATAHFGSWELLGAVVCRRGLPICVVAKPLKGAVNEVIVRHRETAGITLIHPRGSIQRSVELLAEGKVVCMLVDQVISKDRGVFVPFFGRPSSTTPGLSVTALRSGAPVLVGMAAREGDKLRLVFEGPFPVPRTGDDAADVKAHTAQITQALERHIRRNPDQWLWLHRRWKVQP